MPVAYTHRWRIAVTVLSATLLGAACQRPSRENEAAATPPAENRVPRDILSTEKNRYSQHGEELVIRDFFQDRRNGFFLDVGCAWPVNFSNTYILEKELGWSGIGVDAVVEHARRWRNRRPASRFFNYIVTDHSGGEESFYKTERGDLLGISTLSPEDRRGGKPVAFEEVKVPVITLTDLLDQNGVERVDLLSMDIEGAELMALAGFDIERFLPELAVVEVHAAARAPITEYFTSHGYERLERYDEFDRSNYYFTPKPGTRRAAKRPD